MYVRPYHLNILLRWEIFQFLTDVLTFTDRVEHEMPKTYTNKLQELLTAYDIYDIEVAQERRPTIEQLLEAEERRDYAVRKLYQIIRAYSNYRFDANKEHAAKSLLLTFKRYGTGSKISRQNQDTQTSMISNLLQELARETATQHLATLGLSEVVTALTIDNETFSKEQHIRMKQLAIYVTGVAKSARADVQARFLEFVVVVNALTIVEGPEKYADLKQKISALVSHYVTQAKQRNKRRVVEKKETSI